jgi:hypothetical protein
MSFFIFTGRCDPPRACSSTTLTLKIFFLEFLLKIILFSKFFKMFWVFATEVMTTVAKGIDTPILLMFPQDLLRSGWLNALLACSDRAG